MADPYRTLAERFDEDGVLPLEEIRSLDTTFRSPARRVTIQPEHSPVRRKYGVDIEEADPVPFTAFDADGPASQYASYLALAASESDRLVRTLTDRYLNDSENGDPMGVLIDLYAAWKQSSAPRAETQRLEWIVRSAFGVDLPIRATGDDGERRVFAAPPKDAETTVFLDFYTVALAFLDRWHAAGAADRFDWSDTVEAYRGIRTTVAGNWFVDALADPSRPTYTVDTRSVVWGHSTNQLIEQYYSDGIVVEHEVPLKDVVVAVDHLLPDPETAEAEIHILGGEWTFDAEQVFVAKPDLAVKQPLGEFVLRMRAPGAMTGTEIWIAHHLIEQAAECGATVPSDAEVAIRTLRGWLSSPKVSTVLGERHGDTRSTVNAVLP